MAKSTRPRSMSASEHERPKVISLAKENEEIYTTASVKPIRLARNHPGLRLLQQVRDEAHRFAQHYHHLLRAKRTFDEDIKQGRRPPRGKKSKNQNHRPEPRIRRPINTSKRLTVPGRIIRAKRHPKHGRTILPKTPLKSFRRLRPRKKWTARRKNRSGKSPL